MNKIDVNSLVSEMRALAVQAQNSSSAAQVENPTADNFGDVLVKQLGKVNDLHMESAKMQEQFVLGDPSVTLPEVMVASQKSSIYTQFVISTRDKVVSAYNDIMNMSV